jgi:putative transposase
MQPMGKAAGWRPHRPVHFYVQGGCYFITAACLHHQPLLRSGARRTWFSEFLREQVEAFEAELVAWVVLPNHYHLVVRIEEGRTIADLLRELHARSAHRFNQEDGTPGRQVWYGYWDRCLWTEGDLWSRINYIHRNPVKHGYVMSPEEWLHSSWPLFAEIDPESTEGIGMRRFPAPRQLPHDP